MFVLHTLFLMCIVYIKVHYTFIAKSKCPWKFRTLESTMVAIEWKQTLSGVEELGCLAAGTHICVGSWGQRVIAPAYLPAQLSQSNGWCCWGQPCKAALWCVLFFRCFCKAHLFRKSGSISLTPVSNLLSHSFRFPCPDADRIFTFAFQLRIRIREVCSF